MYIYEWFGVVVVSLLSYNVTTRADSVRLLVWDGCARVYVKQNTRRTRKRYKTSPWTCGAGVTVVSEPTGDADLTSQGAASDADRRCSEKWTSGNQHRGKMDGPKRRWCGKEVDTRDARRKSGEREPKTVKTAPTSEDRRMVADVVGMGSDDIGSAKQFTERKRTLESSKGKCGNKDKTMETAPEYVETTHRLQMSRDMDRDGSDGTVKEKRSSSCMNCRNSDGTMRALRPDGQGHIPKAVSLLRRMDAGRVWLVQHTRSRRPGKQMFNVLRAQFRPGQM